MGIPYYVTRRVCTFFGKGALLAAVAVGLSGAEQAAGHLPVPAQGQVDFARDVQPLLERSCLPCHSGEKAKAKFQVDRREALLRGGESKDPAVGSPGTELEFAL